MRCFRFVPLKTKTRLCNQQSMLTYHTCLLELLKSSNYCDWGHCSFPENQAYKKLLANRHRQKVFQHDCHDLQ